jgi:hypothetical protein
MKPVVLLAAASRDPEFLEVLFSITTDNPRSRVTLGSMASHCIHGKPVEQHAFTEYATQVNRRPVFGIILMTRPTGQNGKDMTAWWHVYREWPLHVSLFKVVCIGCAACPVHLATVGLTWHTSHPQARWLSWVDGARCCKRVARA